MANKQMGANPSISSTSTDTVRGKDIFPYNPIVVINSTDTAPPVGTPAGTVVIKKRS